MDSIVCRKNSPIVKYSFHQHKNREIVCQTEGSATTQVGDKIFTLYEGDVMLIPPNTPHKGYATLPFRDLSIHAAQIDFNQFAIVKDYRGRDCRYHLDRRKLRFFRQPLFFHLL